MSRSSFKGPFVNPNIINKIKILKSKKTNIIKIFSKNILILPEYVDKSFLIYNGKEWVSRILTKEMVGFILGSFVFTRKIYKYRKK